MTRTSAISNRRMMSLLLAVIMLLISLYLFSSWVRPAFSEVRDSRNLLLANQKSLEAKEAAASAISNLYGEFQDASGVQNLLADSLPLGDDVPQSVYQLQSLARVSGLNLQNVSVEIQPPLSGEEDSLVRKIGTMRINFRAAGDYKGLKRFVSFLEGNLMLMDVVNLRVTQLPSTLGSLSFNFEVDTYYQE